jgi:hypothetical protein
MKKIIFTIAIIITTIFAIRNSAQAQCAMCKMPAESNLKNGGASGTGLNTGILYMFLAPYMVVGTIGYLWWRGKQQHQDDLENLEIQRVIDAAEQDLAH